MEKLHGELMMCIIIRGREGSNVNFCYVDYETAKLRLPVFGIL